MCRIAGIISKKQEQKEIASNLKSMCDSMAHGGPDDQGFYQIEANGIAFGHRRLALIDLSPLGHQPMTYDMNSLVITFNGEIYNYLELKAELEILGSSFQTKSDTEVILAGYAQWGIEVFNRLKGMFAFALHDKNTNFSYLVRDPSGIKPLYYTAPSEQLIFASEVKAFNQLSKSYPENTDWKIYFLAFGHIPEPYTTLQNVFMLPKGNYLKWDHQLDKVVEIKSYVIKNEISKLSHSIDANIAVKNALHLALKRHLIADAPIGVFLSGGIDSSLITLLADEIMRSDKNKTQDQPLLNTVSINFENPKFSEKPYQDLVLTKVNAKHAEYQVNQSFFNRHFPTALAALDQPSADGINSWFVNYFAKKNGLKAVLSGIGADEYFGGYPSFKRMRWVNILSGLPPFLFKSSLNFAKPSLKRLYYLGYKNTVGKYLFLRGFFTPDDIACLLDITVKEVDGVLKRMQISVIPNDLEPEEEASWIESNLYMQNQLLKDTDSMSMQHGVEVRVPYLDQDLIDLVQSLPNTIKYKTTKPKGLLIDSFINLIPRKIWDRPKMGFTFPFQYWLQEDQYFLNAMDVSKNMKASQLIDKFKDGNLHWSKALAIYQIFKKKTDK